MLKQNVQLTTKTVDLRYFPKIQKTVHLLALKATANILVKEE